MKVITSAILALHLSLVHGWSTKKVSMGNLALASQSKQYLSSPSTTRLSAAAEGTPTEENPCWQDLYDDDCSMSSVYSASFVASKWIKEMPCAAGLEDCDYPEDLNLPGPHQDAGVDQVDVMEFLNLKRADSVDKKSDSDVAP